MHFLVDAQLPPALAENLRATGHVAEHVYEIGLGVAHDSEIWAHAKKHKAVLVTKDEDFVDLGRRDRTGVAVVWIRLGNTTNRALWTTLEPLLAEITDALDRGERLIEIV